MLFVGVVCCGDGRSGLNSIILKLESFSLALISARHFRHKRTCVEHTPNSKGHVRGSHKKDRGLWTKNHKIANGSFQGGLLLRII